MFFIKKKLEEEKKLNNEINNDVNNEIDNNIEKKEDNLEDNINKEKYPEPLPDFEDFKSLEKKFTVQDVPGDGNCLFNSLSYLIFETTDYNMYIRQKICDYMSLTNFNDIYADKINYENYIKNMRKDGVYGSGEETKAFCKLYKIRITTYVRFPTDGDRTKEDKIIKTVYGKEYKENFAIMLIDYGKKNEINNHFCALIPREGHNIDKTKLLNIKKDLCDIEDDYENVEEKIKNKAVPTISAKTGKLTGSRKGESTWDIYFPITRKNEERNTYKLYEIKTKNCDLKEKVIYTRIEKCLYLSEIIDSFINIDKSGVDYIVKNYKNILIDKINNKIVTNIELVKIMNIIDKIAKLINNCICYECSGINGNGKETFKIYNSLYELKTHCNRSHKGIFDNCILNYAKKESYVEIQIQKHGNYHMIKIEDLLDDDYHDYIKKRRGGYNNDIKIIGENIRSLNETNRALLSNILDTERPDFMLLNECKIGKAKFNMSGYKLELSNNNEVGIIYKDIYI